VIYEDAAGETQSTQVELPYSLKFDCDGVRAADTIQAVAVPAHVLAKAKRERDIEVSCELSASIRMFKKLSGSFVKNIVVGDKKDVSRRGISAYVAAEGETLWDIAKRLAVSADEILTQNPALPEVMQGGEKVIIYRELKLT